MYDGGFLHSAKLKIDLPDSKETLEDAKESRLKLRNKMVQINYATLNALYETFTPQQELSVEQIYFSIPSTSTNGSESKEVTLDLPILKIPKERCAKHMIGNLQLLKNFVEKVIGTVRFKNDHFAAITGYGDYVQGNLMIYHVYYIEGRGHNLFSVKQFCDGDLEVSFRLNTCYVWNLEGDDLLNGSHDSNLYTISIFDMAASSLMCLMSRATSTKSWLWHHRLSNLNFGIINQLTSKDLVDGLLKFKYIKDHLCSASRD
uniref:Retrovirus-related Pol polyprotein from transposon TNT 1-94 n=1 Tax=Tanacetum cinerariifolium TaxID=118510 RepID=A0A6L2KCX1_TANCI|nr:retrovirus-related Pol polyprotein from transposon TNT 1-94 [Tanacetum cinerariifolium]